MNLTLRGKIGQRIIAGFPDSSPNEEFISLIQDYKIGNIVLFRENLTSVAQTAALCAQLQELVQEATGHPALITIDQEGGCVTRLPIDATNVPGAMAIAATGNPDNAFRAGLITGQELRALGIHMDLAPDMDINSNTNNVVIGVRSYGDTPETVSLYGTQMIRGLTQGGVLCCAKHFPGHGDTAVDSHLSMPVVDKDLEQLEKMELRPFAAAIAAGIPAIMSSHILFPKIEPDGIPCTMSRRMMTGLLKEQMGFSGLVISDCMEMNAIKQTFGSVQGILAAMNAGVDLVCISHTPHVAMEAVEAAEKAVEEGKLSLAELDASVERILRAKAQFVQPVTGDLRIVGCEEHRCENAKIRQQTLTEIQIPATGKPRLGNAPWFLGSYPFRITLASNLLDASVSFAQGLSDRLGGKGTLTSENPTDAEIAALVSQASAHSCIVVGTYNGHLQPGQLALIRAMDAAGTPTIAVALRNPYDLQNLPETVYAVAAYEYTSLILDALARLLKGEVTATGCLPVRM